MGNGKGEKREQVQEYMNKFIYNSINKIKFNTNLEHNVTITMTKHV